MAMANSGLSWLRGGALLHETAGISGGEKVVEMSLPSTGLGLALDGVGLVDAGRVGRKAATLGELKRAGFPAPEGVLLTTEALVRTLAAAGLGGARGGAGWIWRAHGGNFRCRSLARTTSGSRGSRGSACLRCRQRKRAATAWGFLLIRARRIPHRLLLASIRPSRLLGPVIFRLADVLELDGRC